LCCPAARQLQAEVPWGDGVRCRPGLVCRVAAGPAYPGQLLGPGSDGAGVTGSGPADVASCRVFESEQRLSPPGPGFFVRGQGRGTWSEEERPRALRPQVPKPPRCSPGAANRTCILIARVGMRSGCRCSGVSNPIRIPERRAAGWVWGRPPPTCAGSSRWVPSLEGLGLAKTPRCLPRHVVRGWHAETFSVVPVGA
jgi:hypothetical protein